MIEVERGKTKTLTLTTSATATNVKISITHDLGDVVLAETAAAGSGTSFTYALTSSDTNSSGVHKITWKYTIGTEQTKVEYIFVYQPYTTSSAFFVDYPELEASFDEKFKRMERIVRGVIDTYCGQSFGFFPSKTLKLEGSNRDYLHTGYRVNAISSILKDGDSTQDVIADVEISPESAFYLRRKKNNIASKDYLEKEFLEFKGRGYFRRSTTYHIKGDFGWPYVPLNVEEAAKILIADYFNQDSDHRKHGAIFVGVGPVQTNYKGDLFGTTGNIDADVLLMDYTRFILDHI